MAWENYKPTKVEADLIRDGFEALADLMRSHNEAEQLAADARGTKREGRLPALAGYALACKAYCQGMQKPDALLADYYYFKPYAVYLRGMGAHLKADPAGRISLAAHAHESAFQRMIEQILPA